MNRIQPDISLPKQKVIQNYIAILNQSGTAAPIATELFNDSNITIEWIRSEAGTYIATLTNYTDPDFDLRNCATVFVQTSVGGTPTSVDMFENQFTITTWNGTAYADSNILNAGLKIQIITDKI